MTALGWGAGERRALTAAPWLAPVLHRAWVDLHWLLVALAMASAGLIFFGWRALLVLAVTAAAALGSSLLVRVVVQLLRPARQFDSPLHVLNLALLLGLALPMTLGLAIPALSGLLLGILAHLVGRGRRVRLHPVAMVLVLVWAMPALATWSAEPLRRSNFDPIHAVLKPTRVVLGDLADVGRERPHEPWWIASPEADRDAIRRLPPAELVLRERRRMLEQETMLVQMLTSAELCRLEELLLGCVPGMIGGSSRGLLLFLGLYLMHKRLAWWPMALAALAAALATLAVMPMGGPDGGIVLTRLLARPAPLAITYLAYMILASPLVMVVLILAPITAPISAAGRLVYGAIIGATAVAATWFVPLPPAAFLSLVLASLLSRPLDLLQRSPMAR